MIKFVGGPHDGEERDIHKNTEEWRFEDGSIRYHRSRLENGEEVFLFDPHHQRRIEQAKVRAVGESLDQRMEEMMRDVPPPPRASDERRRRR